MKKSTQIYLAIALIGVILIGLGSGISVFEISNYKTADYTASTVDPALPVLETSTETLEVTLNGKEPFYLNTYGWYYGANDYDVEIDNSLQNKVLVKITQPKDLYNLHLSHNDKNSYTLYTESRDLDMFRLILQAAKEGYIISNLPDNHITLVMNETDAKKFTLNEERDRAETAAEGYREEIDSLRDDYQNQISEMQDQRQNEIDELREGYDNQLEELRTNYENQLEQKQSQIEQLQQQLEDIRSSLN